MRKINAPPEYSGGVLFALLSGVIAIQFASHKRLAAFGGAVDDENGERLPIHDSRHVQKLADKGSGNGGVLGPGGVDDRQDIVVLEGAVSLFLGVIVQRPEIHRDADAIGGLLHHHSRRFGQLVKGLLVGGVGVGLNDFHDILTFSPLCR